MRIRPYRFYLFDLDRTLWNFDANSERAIHLLIQKNSTLYKGITDVEQVDSLHRFFLKYDVVNHSLWGLYEKGELSKEDLRWRRFYDAFLPYGIDDEKMARKFGEDYLDRMILEKELMPGALELLQQIRQSGGRMALLSNGFKEVQYHKLRRSGIADFFSAVVISDEVGCQKPDARIFEIALERISGLTADGDSGQWQTAKKMTLMVGDDPENDIRGAMDFGIDQFYYNHKRRPSIGATYESPDLTPLILQTRP